MIIISNKKVRKIKVKKYKEFLMTQLSLDSFLTYFLRKYYYIKKRFLIDSFKKQKIIAFDLECPIALRFLFDFKEKIEEITFINYRDYLLSLLFDERLRKSLNIKRHDIPLLYRFRYKNFFKKFNLFSLIKKYPPIRTIIIGTTDSELIEITMSLISYYLKKRDIKHKIIYY